MRSDGRLELIVEFDRLEREIAALATPISERAFAWRPEGGAAWSIGLCIDHLTTTNHAYLERLSEAVAGVEPSAGTPHRRICPGLLGRWFLWALEPPPRFKVSAPKKIRPDERTAGDRVAVLERFAASQEAIRALLRATAEIAVESRRFRNPFVRDWRLFTVAEGFLILAAHERRHLFQARRVAERPDFPG